MRRVALLGLIAGLSAGCGGSGRVPVYPVAGQVTINGKAPPEGWVAALHWDPDPGAPYPHPLPRARIGPDGRFQFRTYETGDGAPAGTYRISFIDMGGVTGDRGTAEGADEKDDEESARSAKIPKGPKKPKDDKKSRQVYWPTPVEVRPEPNELPPFDLKR